MGRTGMGILRKEFDLEEEPFIKVAMSSRVRLHLQRMKVLEAARSRHNNRNPAEVVRKEIADSATPGILLNNMFGEPPTEAVAQDCEQQ